MRMKRMMIALLAGLLAAVMCLAGAVAEGAVVTVSGTAQVSAPTDRAVIHLGVHTRADTPSEAQRENNQRTEAVMQALTESCGIAMDKIATSNFSIYTMSEWVSDKESEKMYYQVVHDLSVTVLNIDQTGSVIDACVAAGANVINYVSFESSGIQAAYDQALGEAFADAKRKAELIAAAAGMKLGDVQSISTQGSGEGVYNNTFRLKADAEEDAGASATQLSPGTQHTSATVTVTWSMTH